MKILQSIKIVCVVALVGVTQLSAQEQRSAEQVFKKWFSWQTILQDAPIQEYVKYIDNPAYLASFKVQYRTVSSRLRSVVPFLQALTDGQINEKGFQLTAPIQQQFAANLAAFYNFVDADVEQLVSLLKDLKLNDAQTDQHETAIDHNVVEKYTILASLLFPVSNKVDEVPILFAFSNRLFEWSFGKGWPTFKSMHMTASDHPLVRFFYTTMWYNLAGSGWKNWHAESLALLKAQADSGKRIKYLAGGSDIYQLIKAGIYNITVIDPQLPTQPKYYADEWAFLIQGHDGDQIAFNFGDKAITMRRTSQVTSAAVNSIKLETGQVADIPHATITWTLYDEKRAVLGTCVFERRTLVQDDFVKRDDEVLLISFNELYFIALPKILHGWGIEPCLLAPDLQIVVKQLRRPVSKAALCNLHAATLLSFSDLHFIALGTCIN